MAHEDNVPVQEHEVAPQGNEQETTEEVVSGTFAEIVKALQKKCGKAITRTVKNFNFEILDNYTRFSFTLREPIKAYVNNIETDEYELGKSTVVFSSAYAFAGMLKENDDLAFVANDTIINPKLVSLLTIGGTIDIIQQFVPVGEEYVNPFSSDPEPIVFEHDVIINHIVGMKPGKTGLKFLDKYMDKMMDMI